MDLIFSSYSFVLSQDCDLDGAFKLQNELNRNSLNQNKFINGNKYLPSILITIGFDAEDVRIGEYLTDIGLKMKISLFLIIRDFTKSLYKFTRLCPIKTNQLIRALNY